MRILVVCGANTNFGVRAQTERIECDLGLRNPMVGQYPSKDGTPGASRKHSIGKRRTLATS